MHELANGRILLLFSRPFAFRDASTIREHIGSLPRHSAFSFFTANTNYGFPPSLSGQRFDAIVLHYTLFASAVFGLNAQWLEYIDRCTSSYKIAFFQDEYFACPHRFAFLRDHRIDCVYTLLNAEWAPRVYGDHANIETVIPTLAGYVSEDMVRATSKFALSDAERSIDIGYRSRPLLPYMGRAAREKTFIAEETKRRSAGLGLHLDIETSEQHRLYGNAWYRFLGLCKTSLGVEAGVSVFDLEGVVYRRYLDLLETRPDASFEEMAQLLAPVMDPWEDRVFYRTISPRHFEAAAFGICQVMFEGRYSDILEPMRHYIPLKKDFSNFGDVLELLQSPAERERITKGAYADLIRSGAFSYRDFARGFDLMLLRIGLKPPAVRVTASATTRLAFSRPRELPRVSRQILRAVLWGIRSWTQRSRFSRRFILPVAGPAIERAEQWYKKCRQRRAREGSEP